MSGDFFHQKNVTVELEQKSINSEKIAREIDKQVRQFIPHASAARDDTEIQVSLDEIEHILTSFKDELEQIRSFKVIYQELQSAPHQIRTLVTVQYIQRHCYNRSELKYYIYENTSYQKEDDEHII